MKQIKKILTFSLTLMLACVLLLGNSMTAKANSSNNQHLKVLRVSHEAKTNYFNVMAYGSKVDLYCEADWISFKSKSLQKAPNCFGGLSFTYTTKANTGDRQRVATVQVRFTGGDYRDSNFSFQIVQEANNKDHKPLYDNSNLKQIEIYNENAYFAFYLTSYSDKVNITCKGVPMEVYNVTKCTYQVIGRCGSYSGDYSREMQVIIDYDEATKDPRDKDMTIKVTQKGRPVAPTIKIGETTYKTPSIINGVATINYDKATYIDSMQKIVFPDESRVFRHRSEPVKVGAYEYLSIQEQYCDYFNNCEGSGHTIKAWFINCHYSLNGNKWSVVPEMLITIGYEGKAMQKETAKYKIRFTNVRLAAGPIALRGVPYKEGYTPGSPTPPSTNSYLPKCHICNMSVPDVPKHISECHVNYGSNWSTSGIYTGSTNNSANSTSATKTNTNTNKTSVSTNSTRKSKCPHCFRSFNETTQENKNLVKHVKDKHPGMLQTVNGGVYYYYYLR